MIVLRLFLLFLLLPSCCQNSVLMPSFDYLKASVPIKVCNDFNQIGRKDMHSFLSIMTKHRNVCAHGDRFFNYRTKDSITDTPIHKKLHIPQISGRYQMGKMIFSQKSLFWNIFWIKKISGIFIMN